MQRKVLPIQHTNALKTALNILRSNGVIAIPTDTVYGIACLASDTQAVEKLYAIKGRNSSKAIPILIGEIDQLSQIALPWNEQSDLLAQHFWPGALTLIFKKQPNLSKMISPYPTIAVRIPDHTWLRNLIIQSGPLAATSANLSGLQTAKTAGEVFDQLGSQIDLVIDGGECKRGIPSTVVDCSGEEIKVIREGAIDSVDLWQVLD